jgi:protein-S-isoprenylcysteine O-methyltransferase Ste14
VDSVRYFLALITLLGLAPGLLLWFFIHPFVGFWRRLGPVWTYALLSVPVVALMVGVFRARPALLEREYGTHFVLVGLGVLCLICGAMITRKRRRHLTFGVLAGIPELSSKPHSQKLLTEGIYSRIRHPRYVELMLWLLGYALIANYLALYIALPVSLTALYFIVVLEERELRDRFGSEYEEYCRAVPRFIPRPVPRD